MYFYAPFSVPMSHFNLPGRMGHIATGVSAEYTVVKKKKRSQDGSGDSTIKIPILCAMHIKNRQNFDGTSTAAILTFLIMPCEHPCTATKKSAHTVFLYIKNSFHAEKN